MAYYCDQECCVENPDYEYDSYNSDEDYMCSSCNTNGSYHELTSPEPNSPHSSNKPRRLQKKPNTKHADPKNPKNPKLKKTSKHSSSKTQTMTITPKDGITININFMFWPENDSSSTSTTRPLKKKRHRSKKRTVRKNTTADATTCPSPTTSNKEEFINDVALPETSNTMTPIIGPPAIEFPIVEPPVTVNFPSNNFQFTKMTF